MAKIVQASDDDYTPQREVKPLNMDTTNHSIKMLNPEFILHTNDYNDLAGLKFVSLVNVRKLNGHLGLIEFQSEHWRGELVNGDFVSIHVDNGAIKVGIAPTYISADINSRTKVIGLFEDKNAGVDDLIKYLHWDLPADWTNLTT